MSRNLLSVSKSCRIANEVCKRIDYFFQSSHAEIPEVIRPSTHIADVLGTEHALSNNGDQSVFEAARATQFAAGAGRLARAFRFAKSQTDYWMNRMVMG